MTKGRGLLRRITGRNRASGGADEDSWDGTIRIAPSASEPGSRGVTSGFFDESPRFYETSETSTHPGRLNLRHQAMFGDNLDVFEGARVLDIASHDGRWSFAALKAGAASVVGIEGRPELVANANETFEQYG